MLLKRTSRICALGGTRRFLVVAAMIAVIAAAASAAAAGDLAATWRTIAQRAAFPVYRPLQTLGLRFDGVTLARYTGCLLASWGNPQSHAGPHFMIYEPGDTSRCGQPGVANEVATAKINGVKVEVLAQCAAWPKCTVKDGETNGILLLFVPERAGKHYAIQLQSAHVSLQHFLKIATSFTRVRAGPPAPPPGRPTLHLSEFLSPDHKVWCNMGTSQGTDGAWCGAGPAAPSGPQRSADLGRSGKVTFCYVRSPSLSQVCFQNWGVGDPVLRYGQRSDVGGFLCSSARNGITCVVESGPNSGRGFQISPTQAVRVGPHAARAAAAAGPTFMVQSWCRGTMLARHPSSVGVSCDGQIIFTNLRWTGWGSAKAVARGTLNRESCVPDCASGPIYRYAARMVASRIGHCGSRRVYTEVVAYAHGEVYRGPSPSCS